MTSKGGRGCWWRSGCRRASVSIATRATFAIEPKREEDGSIRLSNRGVHYAMGAGSVAVGMSVVAVAAGVTRDPGESWQFTIYSGIVSLVCFLIAAASWLSFDVARIGDDGIRWTQRRFLQTRKWTFAIADAEIVPCRIHSPYHVIPEDALESSRHGWLLRCRPNGVMVLASLAQGVNGGVYTDDLPTAMRRLMRSDPETIYLVWMPTLFLTAKARVGACPECGYEIGPLAICPECGVRLRPMATDRERDETGDQGSHGTGTGAR